MIGDLKQANQRIDLFTFVQKIIEPDPKYQYPIEWDNFAALPISTFDHWWTHQIGFKARNEAKQAGKKGVNVFEVPFDNTLVSGIQEIYNESPIRQGRRFPHYRKDLETIRREAGTFLDSSVFIGAFVESPTDRLC